jgi:hypothetical protein
MAERMHPDLVLLQTETPEAQVARMGSGWKFQEQYDKQLELPVHTYEGPDPVKKQVIRDGNQVTQYVYLTKCGLDLGSVTLRLSDVPADVTCKACGGRDAHRQAGSQKKKIAVGA